MAIARLRGLGEPGLNMNLMGPNMPGSRQPNVNAILAPDPEVGVPVNTLPVPDPMGPVPTYRNLPSGGTVGVPMPTGNNGGGLPVLAVTPPYPTEVPSPSWAVPLDPYVDNRTPAQRAKYLEESAKFRAEDDRINAQLDKANAYGKTLVEKLGLILRDELLQRQKRESEGAKGVWSPAQDARDYEQNMPWLLMARFGKDVGVANKAEDYKAELDKVYDKAVAFLVSAGYLPAGAGGGSLSGIDPLYIALGLGVVALFFFKGD